MYLTLWGIAVGLILTAAVWLWLPGIAFAGGFAALAECGRVFP